MQAQLLTKLKPVNILSYSRFVSLQNKKKKEKKDRVWGQTHLRACDIRFVKVL